MPNLDIIKSKKRNNSDKEKSSPCKVIQGDISESPWNMADEKLKEYLGLTGDGPMRSFYMLGFPVLKAFDKYKSTLEVERYWAVLTATRRGYKLGDDIEERYPTQLEEAIVEEQAPVEEIVQELASVS